LKTILFIAITLLSLSAFSQAKTNTYSCKYEAGFYPDNFEKSFTLGANWVHLTAKLEDINHFFDFSIFQSSLGPYLQYFEGTINANNDTTPLVGNSTLLTEGQERIGINNFICDSDITCWTLNCTLNK
jgi:hypothetical protein